MKTTLCETCKHGIVREYEIRFHGETQSETGRKHTTFHLNRCLIDNSFLEIILKCNRYEKAVMKTTYAINT
jgi:hypothetical protein